MYKLAGLGVIRAAKAERVHRSNRACAHGEDIAQNAAHAGGRTLVGFDVGGVVVALHLEDQRLAIADIDHACVFAGAADHLRAIGGQGAQPFLGGLVGAMLVPHGRENAHLGVVWLAPEDVDDLGVFLGGEPVAGDKVGRDGWILHGNSPAGAFAPSYKGKCRGGSGFGRLWAERRRWTKKKAELTARPSPTGRYEATRPQAVNLHNGEIGGRAVQIKAI